MATTTLTASSQIHDLNFGAVLTQFTAPTSCLSTYTSYSTSGSELFYFNHYGSVTHPYNTACYPSQIPLGYAAFDVYYWSPAQCPFGWAPATTFTSSMSGGTIVPIGSDTTAMLCCPSGASYNGAERCETIVSADSDNPQTLNYFLGRLPQTDFAPTEEASQTTITTDLTIIGDGIPVWYQSSDLANFVTSGQIVSSGKVTSGASTSLQSSTSTSTSSGPTSTSTSTQSSTPSPSKGLSNGAKIGIAVGIPMAIFACAIAGFLLYRRRRNVQSSSPSMEELQGLEINKNRLRSGRTDSAQLIELEANSVH